MTWTVAGKRREENPARGSGLIHRIHVGHGMTVTGPVTIVFEELPGRYPKLGLRLIADASVKFTRLDQAEAEIAVAQASELRGK